MSTLNSRGHEVLDTTPLERAVKVKTRSSVFDMIHAELRRAQMAASEERNTPTGVGKTLILFHLLDVSRKHPHGRGEDSEASKEMQRKSETPPRAWGRRPR